MDSHIPEVTPAQVTGALRTLGVREGDTLLFHSSLSSLGRMEGGAEGLIDAVLAAVGPTGTAAVPCLTDITAPFDPQRSPSVVGRVTEAFRLRPAAVRSLHPSHSVAAIGPGARDLTAGHEHTTCCGAGSPYEKLMRLGGWVLLVGVDQDRNTTLHTAEILMDVPYLRSATAPAPSYAASREPVLLDKFPLGHREFIGLDKRLREAGIVGWTRVGNAILRLMPARDLVEFGMDLLRRDPGAFLCQKPRCIFCRWAEARIRLATRGEPDPEDWGARSRRCGCPDTLCEVCYV